MAKRLAIPSQHVELFLVGPTGSLKVPRVQRLTMNTDVPTTDVAELGNANMVGTVLDIPNITLTVSVFDVGIKAFAVLTGSDPSAYTTKEIHDLGQADAVLYVKDESLSDYAKSGHARRLQIREFAFNYSVDGEATEDYTLVGSEKRWFKNDVIVDKFTTGTTSFTLSQTPLVLKNGNYAMSVILDGAYLDEVTGAPATGEYRIVGTTLTTGDTRSSQCIAIYHANPAGTNWTDVSDATLPAAIRGRDVNITIGANEIKRVQSITVNGNLNVQNVREMGSRVIAGYQRQTPTVNGTITVLDTDTELIELLTTGQINASGVTEFTVGESCPSSGVSVKIELVDPCDTTVPYTVLKTVYLPSISIVGDSFTSNVNNNATQTFNYRSTDARVLVYSGAM